MPDANGTGPPDELPDLPPEWGRVVVPDDPSMLAQEAAQLRQELGRTPPSAAGGRVRRTPSAALVVPLLILLAAVLTTTAGLAAISRPRSAPPSAGTETPSSREPANAVGRPLPALDLVDPAQAPVPLRSLVPAVILLVDACTCPERVAEAVTAAPAGVTVVTVVDGSISTAGVDPAPAPRRLADPAGGLRALLPASPAPGTVDALLVDRSGVVIRVVPAVDSVEDYRADLARLTG